MTARDLDVIGEIQNTCLLIKISLWSNWLHWQTRGWISCTKTSFVHVWNCGTESWETGTSQGEIMCIQSFTSCNWIFIDWIWQSVAVILADADDQFSLDSMVKQTRVVISTVGPYLKYGEPLGIFWILSNLTFQSSHAYATRQITWIWLEKRCLSKIWLISTMIQP